MESKIKIKLGPIEVEYEGSEKFLKEELPELIKTVSELYKTSNIKTESTDPSLNPPGKSPSLKITTGSIAAKIGCKNGPDLIMAACTSLTLVQKTENFTRKQILDEMKKATGFYKSSYNANLSQNLQQLVKDQKIIETSSGYYCLDAKVSIDMEKMLA